MAKADLHAHSKYSEHPSEWFLQRLGAAESYTEPETIYRLAKARGMDFVTITDHNRLEGALRLCEAHPADVFTGVEATAYFPEDGCKIHVLVYGLEPPEFEELQKIRRDIYALRDFLNQRNLAHSIAHATFYVNDKLRFHHLEKLMLLFNVFEGINGGRNRVNNETWMSALHALTPDRIEDLRRRHGIEPFGPSPWVKTFTGGSDDHAGIFVGRSFTATAADSPRQFLLRLRQGRTWAEGRHNDYQSLAFTFYKVAFDFSKSKSASLAPSFLSQVTENLFNRDSGQEPPLKAWFRKRRIRSLKKKSKDEISTRFLDLVEIIQRRSDTPLEERLDIVYEKLAGISDAFFAPLLRSLEEDLAKADLVSLVRNISSSLPGLFLSAPFFSTLKHMHQGRHLLEQLEDKYSDAAPARKKRVLWFTDTLTDLNGVSVTLKTIGRLARDLKRDITVVTCLTAKETSAGVPTGVLNLPFLHAFPIPGYESYKLRIPSLLHSLKEIARLEPDAVFVSTPGPLGWLGYLISRLFNVPAVGIYHTDFPLQVSEIIKDDDIVRLLESYTKWFYGLMDEIRVPSREYIRLLTERGFDPGKMSVFRRGVDGRHFAPRPGARLRLAERYGIGEGPILLYAGRLSQDKKLDFLLNVYRQVVERRPDIHLIIAGDGPSAEDLQKKARGLRRIVFTGPLPNEELPDLYSGADLFVFPSTTDTYGMAVIEAQACGLPAVVSDAGGPQELVRPGRTGFVVPSGSVLDWQSEIEHALSLAEEKPDVFAAMREEARRSALLASDWEIILDEITDRRPVLPEWPGKGTASLRPAQA